MKKQVVFKIIAVSLPLLFFLILELVLRSAGYGQDYQLFHKVPVENQPDYLVMNKKIAGKYFKDNGLRSDNQSDLFLKEKTDSTFRVFVQGASTVVGFPFYRGGSFPRMLKHRLSLTFPERNIEVINTGITAVNSYTLWDLSDAIIAQQPDLVIIYAGHNEYYGALGAGSSISYGSYPIAIRTYLKLKKLRIFQLFENAYYKMVSSTVQKPSERETTLMEVLAKEQRIPYNSEVFLAGVDQFESNLDIVLSRYTRHHIPVILSTVVSNEQDIAPFISDSIPNKNQFFEDLQKESPEAIDLAQHNALAAYGLGKHYLEKNLDSAKKYFHLAKELDYLRFRAPDTINGIIRNLANKHGVSMLDMENVFSSRSSNQLIGNELMTEHVHPNIKGQFLMADAFYQKIKALNLIDDWSHYISSEDAFTDIPISKIDSLQGKLVVDELKRSWPYDMSMTGKRPQSEWTETYSFEEKLAKDLHDKVITWDQAMAIAYNAYRAEKEYKKGLQVAESLIFEYPEQAKVYEMAGSMSSYLGDYQRAIYYYSIYNKRAKSAASAEALGTAYVKAEDFESAEQTLKDATRRGLKVKNVNSLIENSKN